MEKHMALQRTTVDGEHVWTTLLWFRCGVPSKHMTGFAVIRPNPEAAHRFWQTLSHSTPPSGSLLPPSHVFHHHTNERRSGAAVITTPLRVVWGQP